MQEQLDPIEINVFMKHWVDMNILKFARLCLSNNYNHSIFISKNIRNYMNIFMFNSQHFLPWSHQTRTTELYEIT